MTLPTMKQRIQDDPDGEKSTKNAARKRDLQHTLIIPGSGLTRKKFEDAGITAILGSGFDPGVTSVYSAYALKHYFDEIHYIDILDCNGGDHGYPFATNFNPEINFEKYLRWVLTGKMVTG